MNRYPGNNIHETAIIYDGVLMGTGNTIGAFCIIGSPAEWKNHTDGSGNVIIGNNNTITGMVTIDSGVNVPTEIWDNCFIMKHAHIGHDAIIQSDVTISCGAKIGGHAIIGEKSNIGLNAVIHQKCIVPDGVMIGASGFVGKKSILKPQHKYAGVPVREIGINL
jgi:UDP-N-acetylglucosamine acyltransferase